MTSTTGSETLSAKAVKCAAVVTHGKPQEIGSALARLETVAREAGVELRMGEEETAKHGLEAEQADATDVDLAVVLGGDGTMLRALNRFLGTDVPVIGVNFGRVGFLSSIPRDELEAGLARVFAGDYRVEQLPDPRRRGRRGAPGRRQRPGRLERDRRPHDPARVGGRRRGARPARLRRRRLRDPVRLDGLQLLERRARCSSGDSTRCP